MPIDRNSQPPAGCGSGLGGGAPPGAGSSKLDKAEVDPARYVLSTEILEAVEKTRRGSMGASYGFDSYDEVGQQMWQW